MKISREWAMPNKETFQCKPIGDFVNRYLSMSNISIDPFARNCEWATYTNDLDPTTKSDFHMDALEFLEMLKKQKVKADLAIIDPPYSLRQMKECYSSFGRKIKQRESTNFYGDLRKAIDLVVVPGGLVLSFGWNSIGMGKTRGYEIQEILLVCHGRAHNDTICVADLKNSHQLSYL